MKINFSEIPAFYINLEYACDRKERMEEMLSQCNYKNFSRIDAIGTAANEWPWKGQNQSYVKACTQTLAPFIVLEDDIALHSWIPSIEVPDNADAVYLAGSILFSEDFHLQAYSTEFKNVVRVYDMLTNCAILFLSQELVNEYTEILKSNVRGDVAMSSLSHKYNFYAVNPVIFYHNDPNPAMEVPNKNTRVYDYVNRLLF